MMVVVVVVVMMMMGYTADSWAYNEKTKLLKQALVIWVEVLTKQLSIQIIVLYADGNRSRII